MTYGKLLINLYSRCTRVQRSGQFSQLDIYPVHLPWLFETSGQREEAYRSAPFSEGRKALSREIEMYRDRSHVRARWSK